MSEVVVHLAHTPAPMPIMRFCLLYLHRGP